MKSIIVVRDTLITRTNSIGSKFEIANDDILRIYGMYYESPIIDFNRENGLDNELDRFIETYGKNFSNFHSCTYEIVPANQ